MLKLLSPDIFVYDCEWIPCAVTGRLVYGMPADMPDSEVIARMYDEARAKQEKAGRVPDVRPFLKLSLCRVVAISAVKRFERRGEVRLQLKSLPALEGAAMDERDIVDKFLSGVGATKPQLVGYNCRDADLPMLLQRAIAHGLHQPDFGARPNKPWEGVDYFAKATDFHVDLLDIASNYSRGNSMPTLHELCVASGIPGKFLAGGDDVAGLWRAGELSKIVAYNQCDVLSQYELLMRVALLAGLIAPAAYAKEQLVFEQLLSDLIALNATATKHLAAYLAERQRLRTALGLTAPDPAPAAATAPPLLELTA